MEISGIMNLPFINAVAFDTEQGRYIFNEKEVGEILLHDDIKNKPVVIISVAGAFRKGKSFLLNFFVRFLTYVSLHGFTNTQEWLGDSEQPLSGFPWRGGSERETTGILLWAQPFVLKHANGDEIVVLLMDTQGAFDSTSSVKDCAIIFAISTMMSSTQIYNISGNLQEDYLAHLHVLFV
ncbi:Atlastin [Thelohanellus kitauei]|uniref:Atlastin n=1 Tax=Thelohanellus kitauei TaxID=669202 RepID=A0A0C2JXH2_THEKT|nr:Atlastin [Thelohanellus kitauei]